MEASEQTVRQDDQDHVFHSWSAQRNLNSLPVAGAEGCHFWDYQGNRYLDFASQLVFANLGHQHPALVAAIKEQAERLCTVGPSFANAARGELARLIAERAPGDLNHVFFTNGGTEANEHAIRMARLHTGRFKVLSAYRSYHGATGASITATGEPRRWGSEPGMAGIVHFLGPYLYRSSFHATSEDEEARFALEHLRQIVEFEGPHTVAAIMLETVVGTNGVLLPPPGYLAGVRALCDEFGIAMICDEVMVGFGRIGEWFAVNAWGVTPDLITFAKGVNSGYVPLGGVVISERVRESFMDRPYPGGLTYSGHPLACAAGVASIRVFEESGVLEHVRDLGERVVRPALDAIAETHPSVGEVRGRGLMWAIELVRDRSSKEMLVPFNAAGEAGEPMSRLANRCRELGVWPFTHFNRLHVAPPLVIGEQELRQGLEWIDQALEVADSYVGPQRMS
ncbi:MAG: aminotransferase class III-fold pyridoxal phosphate-dependent enzyme [Candidatus Dormibacteria bacterium]|jgi:taurine--2-oxoglutarate transaminase